MNTFVKNREILADLIYELEEFTTDSLLAEFRKRSRDGSIMIDGGQTVQGFLEELRDLGALEGSRIWKRWKVIGRSSLRG